MRKRSGPTALVAVVALLVSGASSALATPAAPDPDSTPSLTQEAEASSAPESGTVNQTQDREALQGVDSETGLWVVQLEAPSVAAKFGGAASSEAARYGEQLTAEHTELEGDISATLGRDVETTISYKNVLNAVAVEVDTDEAQQLWDIDGVVAVFPDTIQEMETDVSHEVIKTAAAWGGDNAPEIATKGEGVIAAMIDSGVNPDHPSFAATGGDGYTHTNPNGAGVFLGACNTEATLECNDKLIGAYSFNGPTARDTDGHGSHTGSTMAGNAHTAEFTLGTADFEREISGVAPHANVISYKVCNPGCPSTATVQAVDQAITDGVDVINYSISGSDSPWTDMVDLAFLEAHNAGISVSASAGNDGPGVSTVAKSGPWNLSVAATTHNRVFGNPVSVTSEGAPAELVGIPGFPGDGPGITSVYTGDLVDADVVTPGNGNGCAAFPANSMDGAIALIQRGACNFQVKVDNASAAGAIAVVMFNNVGGPPTAPGGLTTTTIPAVMITLESGEALQAYAAANDPTEVSIGTDVVLVQDDSWTDLVAGFSSRGPSQFDMLVPTLAAPGVNILAAYAADGDDPLQYGVISGTSMASPHAAGMAVLMREVYPELTPTEIRSVMASTADFEGLLKENGSTPADAFDIGSGRINIDQAGRAGLALNETGENFAAANPAIGGEPSTLNLPAFVEHNCEGECSWTRTLTSIAQGPATYTAAVDAPEGITVTVTPETFSLEPGAEQEITVTANVTGGTIGAWSHARVTLETTDQHADGVDIANQHFPVAVKTTSTEVPVEEPTIEVDPASLASTQATDTVTTQTVTIGNTGEADLTWAFVAETAGGDGVLAEQEVNGTSGIVSDDFPNDGGGVFSADDFTLATDSSLTSLYTPGFWVNGDVALRSPAIDWQIFADDDGAPGEDLWSHTAAPGDPELEIVDNEITLDLEAAGGAVDLSAGTYWLSVWPTVTDPVPNLNDRWNWYQGAPSGNPGMLIDPNDQFGAGATDWTPIVDLVGTFSDLAYTIEGTAGPQSCGADWLSVDPTSGTTAPDGSTEVTASFDSAGLTLGDYSTQLCVESNDPANPVVTVPVTLTVEEAPTAPVITVDPTSVEGSQVPDTTSEHTLTVGNDGTADLDYSITETAAAGAVDRVELPQGTDRAHASAEAGTGASAPATVAPVAVPAVASLTEGFDDVATLPSAGWAIKNNSEPVGLASWFQGNAADVFPSHEGAPDAYVGANYNSAGASPGHISNWLMTPEVDLVNGSEFSFWTRTSDDPAAWVDRLEVRLSTSGDSTDVGTGYEGVGDFDTLLVSVNPDLTATGYPAEWTQYTATIEGLDAPATGRVAFHYWVPNGGPAGDNSNFVGVDTVTYTAADVAPACEVVDAAWLSVDPTSGTVAPGGSADVTVTLDSAGLAVGDYTANLCVESNDPVTPVVNVPVTLTVTDDGGPVDPAVVQRIHGEDRYATAAEISAAFPDGVDTVYVANGTEAAEGADALAAGAAGAKGALGYIPDTTPDGDPAPILLVRQDQIPGATADALAALAPSEVIIVGGTASVSAGVEDVLGESADVRRIAGSDRYKTAALIAAEYGSVDTIYVATGQSGSGSQVALADALTASSVAGSQGAPVVLTRSGSLPAATAAAIADLDPSNIVVVGGKAAVSDAVLSQLNALAPTERVAGSNRYKTAVALTADYAADGDMLFIASGVSFPDALAGSSLTGSQQAPLLLTKGESLPSAVAAEILRLSPQGITIFGGSAAVDEAVEAELQELLDTTSTD